jgi:hypothetical protein
MVGKEKLQLNVGSIPRLWPSSEFRERADKPVLKSPNSILPYTHAVRGLLLVRRSPHQAARLCKGLDGENSI